MGPLWWYVVGPKQAATKRRPYTLYGARHKRLPSWRAIMCAFSFVRVWG